MEATTQVSQTLQEDNSDMWPESGQLESKIITSWQGKNVNDMTKQELIEALIELGQLKEQEALRRSKDLV